jgi:hypothetical protein
LPEKLHIEFERVVVPSASKLTFAKFDHRARTIRERMDSSTIQERHLKSLADRESLFEPGRDGVVEPLPLRPRGLGCV